MFAVVRDEHFLLFLPVLLTVVENVKHSFYSFAAVCGFVAFFIQRTKQQYKKKSPSLLYNIPFRLY